MFPSMSKAASKKNLSTLQESKNKLHWLSTPKLNVESPQSFKGVSKFFNKSITHIFNIQWSSGIKKRLNVSKNIYEVNAASMGSTREIEMDVLGFDCGVVLLNSIGVIEENVTSSIQYFQASTPVFKTQSDSDISSSSFISNGDSGVYSSIEKTEVINSDESLESQQHAQVLKCFNASEPNFGSVQTEVNLSINPLQLKCSVNVESVRSQEPNIILEETDLVNLWKPQSVCSVVGSYGAGSSSSSSFPDGSVYRYVGGSDSSYNSSDDYSTSISSSGSEYYPDTLPKRSFSVARDLYQCASILQKLNDGNATSKSRQTYDNLTSIVDLKYDDAVLENVYPASDYGEDSVSSANGHPVLKQSSSVPCNQVHFYNAGKVDVAKFPENHQQMQLKSHDRFFGVSTETVESLLELQHAMEQGSIFERSNLNPNDATHLRLLKEFCQGWERRWCMDCEYWLGCECQAVRHAVLEHRFWDAPYICDLCYSEFTHPVKLIHHIQKTHEPPAQHETGLAVYMYPRF